MRVSISQMTLEDVILIVVVLLEEKGAHTKPSRVQRRDQSFPSVILQCTHLVFIVITSEEGALQFRKTLYVAVGDFGISLQVQSVSAIVNPYRSRGF